MVQVQWRSPGDHTPVAGLKQPPNAAARGTYPLSGHILVCSGECQERPSPADGREQQITRSAALCCAALPSGHSQGVCVEHHSTEEIFAYTFRTRMGCCVYKMWSPEHPRAENSIQSFLEWQQWFCKIFEGGTGLLLSGSTLDAIPDVIMPQWNTKADNGNVVCWCGFSIFNLTSCSGLGLKIYLVSYHIH